MTEPAPTELVVQTLGAWRFPAPLQGRGGPFVDESSRVLVSSDFRHFQSCLRSGCQLSAFEPAGPRSQTYFAPRSLACGIVTCGGLCPGVNNVIRSMVLTLHYLYGITRVLGFRYGYAGLSSRPEAEPWTLSPQAVDTIHERGGTILGSSRGS